MAKKDSKKITETKEIPTLTSADLASPLIKAWLKQKEQKEREAQKAQLIPGILAVVKKETGLEFSSIKALARYFDPATTKKRGKRTAPLSDKEKGIVTTYKAEGKSVSEIAKLLNKKPAQIYRYLNGK